jgi:hypothetical protein
MATTRKSEGRVIAQKEISHPRDDLKAALEPVATALTEELAALLAAVLDGRKKKTLDRLSQALSQAVPSLLGRVIEDELLASGDTRERRARFVAALRRRETPAKLPQTKSAGKMPGHAADENKDWMSVDAVAQLLNVSPAHVKKLSQGGKLGHVDTGADGVTMLERTAVLLYYQRRKRS